MTIAELLAGKQDRIVRFDNYRDDKPEGLAWLSYGDLPPLKGKPVELTDFYMPELMTGSDYCSSGSVEVSNHRVFLEKYGELPNVHRVQGGFGTFAVVVRLDSITPEMFEDFEALSNYPVLDDEALSEVENEAETAAWEGCYRSDFVKELSKRFPELEETIDTMENPEVDKLFYTLCDRTNTYWEHESGNSAFIRVENVVEGALESDVVKA